MNIPEVTHQQFLALDILAQGEMTGQQVRSELAKRGDSRSGPVFYQFMARLEDAGLVKGWYEQKLVAGQSIKERRYRLTGSGERARQSTLDFYMFHATHGGIVNA